jgi:hypothetical protein
VILDGEGALAGETYEPGTTFLVPAHAEMFAVKARTATRAVCAYEPDLGALRRVLDESGASAEEIGLVLHS